MSHNAIAKPSGPGDGIDTDAFVSDPKASAWRRLSEPSLQMLIVTVLVVALRLVHLDAEPGSLYFNSDEGHQNNDARSLVMHGTAFYDTYSPSTLMPVFTAVKAASMWILGVNIWGIRLPSVLCVSFAAWLLARLWVREGDVFAGWLTLIVLHASYFVYAHSRMGTHEPVLTLFSTLLVVSIYNGLETKSRRWYVAAALLMVSVPLVKTSGVYAFGIVVFTLAILAYADRGRLCGKEIGVAVAVSCGFVLLVALIWWLPHRLELAREWGSFVVNRRNPAIVASLIRTAALMFKLSPLICIGAALAAVAFITRLIRNRTRISSVHLLLIAWTICAALPLVYSNFKPVRFFFWTFVPMTALAMGFVSQVVRQVSEASMFRRRLPWLIAAVVVGAMAWSQGREYRKYASEMTFYIASNIGRVEELVSDHSVAGSGFDDFSAFSDTLKLTSIYSIDTGDCDATATAFPQGPPGFISSFLGSDPGRIVAVLDAFESHSHEMLSGCPEFNVRYRPYLIVPHYRDQGTYQGTYNIWFVRRDIAAVQVPSIGDQVRALADGRGIIGPIR